MTTFHRGFGLLALSLLVGFSVPVMAENLPSLKDALHKDGRFETFLAAPEKYRLQILLGTLETDESGRSRLVQEGYRVDREYFYPASTIKLGAAIAALEALEVLRRETGKPLDLHTPLLFHPLFEGEELESVDPTNLVGEKLTFGHEIHKLFLVSDNQAYNHLYEFLGPDRLHHAMLRVGLLSSRIVHRLSERRTPEENLESPRIDFLGADFQHTQPRRKATLDLPELRIPGLEIGRGFQRGETLDEGPTDFSSKNRMSLLDLQRTLAMVVRPDLEVGRAQFRLSEEHRTFLLQAMSQFPRESRNPVYDEEEYPDHYVKFLLPGLLRVLPEQGLKIYNKVGQAYGFTIENAYVVDEKRGRSFFLAAVIYTNQDGILNNDQYEYDEVASPFMADLGEWAARRVFRVESP